MAGPHNPNPQGEARKSLEETQHEREAEDRRLEALAKRTEEITQAAYDAQQEREQQ